MNRRAALAGLGSSLAGVSGCLDAVLRSNRGTVARDASIEVVGPDPSLEVGLSARQVRPFTDHGPATYEISMTNEAGVERRLGAGSIPPLRKGMAERVDSDATLISVSTEDTTVPDRPDGGCWRARGRFWSHAALRLRDFGPGESRTATRALLAPKHADACYPPGTYRFETAVHLPEVDEGSDAALVVTLE